MYVYTEYDGERSVKLKFISGGNSKTLMVVQVSPVEKNSGETVCSLSFAERIRNVELGQASRKIEKVVNDQF